MEMALRKDYLKQSCASPPYPPFSLSLSLSLFFRLFICIIIGFILIPWLGGAAVGCKQISKNRRLKFGAMSALSFGVVQLLFVLALCAAQLSAKTKKHERYSKSNVVGQKLPDRKEKEFQMQAKKQHDATIMDPLLL